MKYPEGQRAHLSLHGRLLHCRMVLKGQNQLGKAFEWKDADSSSWPLPIFIPFSCAVVNSVNQEVPTAEKTFKKLVRPIRHGLQKASPILGCEPKRKTKYLTRLYLGKKRLADFLVFDLESHPQQDFQKVTNGKKKRDLKGLSEMLRKKNHAFRELERSSPALFRFAVVVFLNGIVWLVPARRRPEGEHHG